MYILSLFYGLSIHNSFSSCPNHFKFSTVVVDKGTSGCSSITSSIYLNWKISVICNRIKIKGAKDKYRGVFEIQKSGDKTSSGEIGLEIRKHASPKVGQDQVSGGVSVLCWHAAPVAYVLWKPCTIR